MKVHSQCEVVKEGRFLVNIHSPRSFRFRFQADAPSATSIAEPRTIDEGATQGHMTLHLYHIVRSLLVTQPYSNQMEQFKYVLKSKINTRSCNRHHHIKTTIVAIIYIYQGPTLPRYHP